MAPNFLRIVFKKSARDILCKKHPTFFALVLTLQVSPLLVGAVESVTNTIFADNHLSKLAASFIGGKKRQSILFCMESHIRHKWVSNMLYRGKLFHLMPFLYLKSTPCLLIFDLYFL